MDCIFCKIANKETPAKIAFENERLVAFHDLFPAAPTHVLIIPKAHHGTLDELSTEHTALVGEMVLTATELARELGIADEGYRVVMNCNANGGQSVYHIHLHLMGGRRMSWPPG